jgi:hypothetical protein
MSASATACRAQEVGALLRSVHAMLGADFERGINMILCKYAEFCRLYSVRIPGLAHGVVDAIVRAAVEEMVEIGASAVARIAREQLEDCEEWSEDD